VYALGWFSWAWALCGSWVPWAPWAHGYAYDSVGYPVKPHYDTEYPYQSHLGRGTSFGSVAVGVGGGGPQLQQRVVQGLSWFMAGFGREGRDLGLFYLFLSVIKALSLSLYP